MPLPLLPTGDGEDCDGVDRGIAHARLYHDAQSDDNDDESADVLKEIIGHVGQREDTGCDDDGVDVSVGVDVGAVVGVGIHGQGVNLGVSLVGVRGKRRGFSPGATARHKSLTRVHTDLYYLYYFSSPLC